MNTREEAHRWSPNQLDKRRRIVEAARTVLARDGLAGCTARSVAEAGPLTKSAIHYYFSDMDDLVDLAMAGHIDAFAARVRAAADHHRKPETRFWAVVREYLETFREMPGTARLWFEYWIDATRKGRPAAIERSHAQVAAVFAEHLAAAGVADAGDRADALFTYLLGAVVRQAVRPRPFSELRPRIALLAGLD
ncbi:MAG TPA: TetR family transcriptional regulator [Streptosporangiaceae bacterium]